MPTTRSHIGNQRPLNRAAQREQTRARMLQAALDVIVKKGMRAVRHREVAKRAGVSLGSTTYHFKSIDDLIMSTFHYWRAPKVMADNPYFYKIRERLECYEDGGVPDSERLEIASWLCEQSIAYVRDQLTGKRDDRIVELAFYHESIRSPSLRELLTKVRRTELDYLAWLHRIMGSPQPKEDARITITLFRQLEQSAVMAVIPELDMDVIQRTIRRHMSLCFGVVLEKNH